MISEIFSRIDWIPIILIGIVIAIIFLVRYSFGFHFRMPVRSIAKSSRPVVRNSVKKARKVRKSKRKVVSKKRSRGPNDYHI